jgi:hypothetical protein
MTTPQMVVKLLSQHEAELRGFAEHAKSAKVRAEAKQMLEKLEAARKGEWMQ